MNEPIKRLGHIAKMTSNTSRNVNKRIPQMWLQTLG